MKEFLALQVANKAGIAFKGLKFMPSRNGQAWNASVYHLGRKVGTVSDAGVGGAPDIQIPKQLQEAVMKTAQEMDFKQGDFDSATSTLHWFNEFFYAAVVDELDWLKKVKSKRKTKTYARFTADPVDTFQIFNATFEPRVKAAILERHPGVIDYFLNEKILELLP